MLRFWGRGGKSKHFTARNKMTPTALSQIWRDYVIHRGPRRIRDFRRQCWVKMKADVMMAAIPKHSLALRLFFSKTFVTVTFPRYTTRIYLFIAPTFAACALSQ